MTFILIALWIAGHEFNWWWVPAAFVLDVIWMLIKLNFFTVLIRRSIEESKTPPGV